MLNFDLDIVLALIEREKISMLPGPPTIYQSILAYPGSENIDTRVFVTDGALHFFTLIYAYKGSEAAFVCHAFGYNDRLFPGQRNNAK